MEEYVAECPECQKIRHSMNDKFPPLLRANHVDHHRQMIGIDGLTITPVDIHGKSYAYVIKVFATKLVAIYPTTTHTAMDVARSLYAFRCTYGHYETVASDPGCDLTAEGVQQYLQWAGQIDTSQMVWRLSIAKSWYFCAHWSVIDTYRTTGVRSRILAPCNSSSTNTSVQRQSQALSVLRSEILMRST